MKIGIANWAAWSPGLENSDEWRKWAAYPTALQDDGIPDARFLPAMLRRRCTPLSKIMLKVAYECCDEAQRIEVRTVFASRHGSINESIGLLECVVREERISPAIFSHTVHNAQAGLFSIASGNCQASSSLAAQGDTFCSGLVEALSHIEREPARPVLLVVGDVPLAEVFADLIDEPTASYAVALLLEANLPGPGFTMQFEGKRDNAISSEGKPPLEWPDAAEFLRFWLGRNQHLQLTAPRHSWAFEKVDQT